MIYFCQKDCGGPVKIGFAEGDDPEWARQRVAALQIGCPEQLVLLGVMEGDRGDEAALHRQFAEGRIRGEWFVPSDDLMALVASNPYEPPPPKPARVPLAQIAVTLHPSWLTTLDELRGPVNRSLWIRRAIEAALEDLVEVPDDWFGSYWLPRLKM